jgi:hypothetical protein
MGGRNHHRVAAQQRRAFLVQVMIGDDIEGETFDGQPVDEMQVRRELPHRAELVAIVGTHVEDRPTPAAVADAASVDVVVVGRQAVLRRGVEFEIQVVERGDHPITLWPVAAFCST